MRICAAVVLCLLAKSAQAGTQPLSSDERAVINFGFATQLGSGIYTMSGRSLQVYRLPFGFAPEAEEGARVRPRFTLPLTFGFVDFKPVDVVETGLPERIDSLSFVPGVALDIVVNDNWELEPFIEAGLAEDRSSEARQQVYATGLRSRYEFGSGPTDWQLYNELLYVVVDQQANEGTDDFTRLRIGTSGRRPLGPPGEGRRADVLGYGLVEVILDPPGGPAGPRPIGGSGLQYEFGFTLGSTGSMKLWRIPLPRVGFGYRFGDGLSVYRIVFGSPY